jgi:2-polyprenyl-3-methyl-5-hydroxy-6-metoxy-1,4-benzoquinol methylase
MTKGKTRSHCPVCAHEGHYAFTGQDLMFSGDRRYDYHACAGCGAVYQYPAPTSEDIKSFYPDDYNIYQPPGKIKLPPGLERAWLKHYGGYTQLDTSLFSDLLAPLTRLFKASRPLRYVADGTLLDVGCGNGKYLLQMQQLGWSVKGVEFNEKAVGLCRSNELDVFQGDLLQANFSSNCFDAITAHHLIEHLPNPVEVIAEMARILKPGGQLLIRTPNTNSLARSWFRNNWFADEVPRHLVLFNPASLTRLAETSGLQVEHITALPRGKLLLYSLDYIVGKKGRSLKKFKPARWLAGLYYPLARISGRGDEIYALFIKP